MTQHATLSASGAAGWMNCYGKPFMEKGLPESSSKFADEGTAAHDVAAMCLEQGQDASAFAGRMIEVKRGEGAQATSRSFEVNEEMVEAVQRYVDIVRGLGGYLLVEQKVDFTRWLFPNGCKIKTVDERTGEEIEGELVLFGTSDAIIILADKKTIIIVDLKYGKGVRVEAEENEQEQLYACGTVDIVNMIEDVTDDWIEELMIVQPRLPSVSKWSTTVGGLKEFATKASVAARHAIHQWQGLAEPKLTPGEKQCCWCKAKGSCPAAATLVHDTVRGPASADDFENLDVADKEDLADLSEDNLGAKMELVDFIEKWCSAVRAEVERRLVEGKPVEGFKLVAGKKGARAWVDAAEAEKVLKSMRVKQEDMYSFSLISPTSANKLATAGKIGARQWAKLQADLITQSEGKPSVAPVSDKRPAITVAVTADDFADVTDDGNDLA